MGFGHIKVRKLSVKTHQPMFILDRPNSDKPTFVFIKTTLKDGPFKASLEAKVLPACWDKKNKRADLRGLDRDTADEYKSINMLLSRIEQFIENRSRDARYNGNFLTVAELSAEVDRQLGRKPAGLSFFDHSRQFIDDMEMGIILTDRGKRYSAGTIKNYRQSLNTIERYDPSLTYQAVSMDWYRLFIKDCNDKDWSMNYIAQHIKNLIQLMQRAFKAGLHANKIYLEDDFAVIQEETDDVVLEPAELATIYNKHLLQKGQEIARDWFILGCYTGLRVSDVQLLDEKNLQGDFIQIVNEKTDTKVVIPMRPEVRAIVKKWNGLPPKVTDQEINRTIKEVCELCKINEVFIYSVTKGGIRQDFYLKKYEMVSCHTMRRIFITHLLENDIPDNIVMQLAGIKKHNTLMRYKKTSPEKTAERMKDHAFFKG